MLPLDHFKHTSNSGTIQASNSFDFHEWAYLKCKRCLDALIMSLARMYAMPINFYLELLEGDACHIMGVHQHILEKSSMFNSFVSLQNLFSSSGLVKISASWSSVPTLSMQMSPFCWWSLMKWWQTSICFVLECWTGLLVSFTTLSLSHSNGTCLNLIPKSLKVASSKVIEHNNYRSKCTPLRRLKVLYYFASLMTKTQVIFPIVVMCPMCSFSQLCIPHNRSPNIQSTKILLL